MVPSIHILREYGASTRAGRQSGSAEGLAGLVAGAPAACREGVGGRMAPFEVPKIEVQAHFRTTPCILEVAI